MKGIGLLAAALLLTALAHFGLPLPQTDPLRSTLVLLPPIVAALVGIGLWAGQRGGRHTPVPIATGEGTLLAVLVLLALARPHLGLGSDPLIERGIAGGLVLLLMHRVAWLVLALRSTVGAELPRRPAGAFFALAFIVYLAILPWSAGQRPPDGDAPHYLLLTHSIAVDFDTDLANNYERADSLAFMDRRLEPQPGDPVGTEGELYSRHNVLLPLVLAPFYRFEGLFGVLIIMAALTALTGWYTLALAHYYAPSHPGPAIAAWSILAFTAPFLLFSYQVWVEIPAALLALIAFIQVQQLRREGSLSKWGWLGLAASVVLLPLLKIRFLLIALPLAAMALWYGGRRSRRAAVLLLVGLLLLTLGTLAFNQLVFQNPLKYHDIDGLQTYAKSPVRYLQGIVGLFFDCAFGLFANAPIWMLLLPALLLMIRERQRLLIDTCVVFLPYFLVLVPRGEWFGAWSPPYRYGVVLLPLLALWLIPLLSRRMRTGGRMLIATFTVLTLVLTTLWIVLPGWTYNIAHGRSHLLDQLSLQISSDVARFLASSIRPRTATLVWPLASLILVGLWWWAGKRRSSNASVPLGIVTVLLLPPLLVWAAENRTTHVIEFEDPWLRPKGGELYPELWVVYRPQFRGGWVVPAGAWIEAPIVAESDSLGLQVDLAVHGVGEAGAIIEIATEKGQILAQESLSASPDWLSLSFEDLPWTPGDVLVLGLRDRGPEAGGNQRIILDRAVLTWH